MYMEIQSTQTSRSIAVIIIIVVLIVVSAIIPAKWLNKGPQVIQKPKLDLSAISSVQEVATDSNNDGVITWREVMADTLHTSTTTLQELKSVPIDQKEVDALNDPNNLTSSFAKNIYLASAYLDKNGITDQASKDEIVAKLIQDEKAKIVTTVYALKDINVAKTETKESVREYGNKLASLLQETLVQDFLKADIYAIGTYAESKDLNDLKDLITNKKRLDSLVQKFLALSVPPSATIYHILTLNKVVAYKDVVEAFSKADSDPLRATFVSTDYPEKVRAITLLNKTLYNYFVFKNIVFLSNEKGYLFTTGYLIKN